MAFIPWQPFDREAWAWIQAVELADGQHLEHGVRYAMNQCVLDLKFTGQWDLIQTMTIRMGARTLAGALIDVKNPSSSWTNVNFVSGDYNRVTGLVGNGTTKYLNTNRNNNADGQNSHAFWTYVTTTSTSANDRYMGCGQSNTGSTAITVASAANLNFRSRNGTGDAVADGNAEGLIGISRSSSTSFTGRAAQRDFSITRNSQTPLAGNTYDYCTNSNGGGSPANYSVHRACASGIGAAQDLAAVEGCLYTMRAALDFWITDAGVYDSDANAWLAAVEATDGQYLESPVRYLGNYLVKELKAKSLWADIVGMTVTMSARTLAGAIIDLKNPGTSWTNNNFVSGDYNRVTGLKGNGSTKSLNTEILANDFSTQNDVAAWTMASEAVSIAAGSIFGTGAPTIANNMGMRRSASTADMITNTYSVGSPSAVTDTGANAVGLMGVSRNNGSNYVSRGAQSSATLTRNSGTPTNQKLVFFARNSSGSILEYGDPRLQMNACGTAHDLGVAESVATSYTNAIARLHFI